MRRKPPEYPDSGTEQAIQHGAWRFAYDAGGDCAPLIDYYADAPFRCFIGGGAVERATISNCWRQRTLLADVSICSFRAKNWQPACGRVAYRLMPMNRQLLPIFRWCKNVQNALPEMSCGRLFPASAILILFLLKRAASARFSFLAHRFIRFFVAETITEF